jgi:hypothetical protein
VRHCPGIEVCVGTVAVVPDGVVEEGLFVLGAHFQAVLGNLNTYARKAQQSE